MEDSMFMTPQTSLTMAPMPPTTDGTPTGMSHRPIRLSSTLDTSKSKLELAEEASEPQTHHRKSLQHSPIQRRPFNDLSSLNLDNETFAKTYELTYEPPPFTIKQLRDVIPPHLFIRCLWTSLAYTVVNLLAIGALGYGATWIPLTPIYIRWILWPIYWWFQGIAGVGIWILAHECGHQAFSDYKQVNHVIGFILHSLVLVPYHSWRISHSQHHASTAHTLLDQAYVPRTKSEYRPRGDPSPWEEAIETAPLFTLITMIGMLLFGWPAYFFFHMSGQTYEGQIVTHFIPSSPIFKAKHKWLVLASDLGLIVMVTGLGLWAVLDSPWTMISLYGIPYLIVNAWLITITLLQHTDVYLPHYSPESWSFVRGALSTVDRDYGWFLNHAFHHIHDSHVAHHLFSQMPFYNATKATPYLKEKLGEYYIYDQTPVWKALYRAVRQCKYIDNTGDILFYRR